MHTHLSFANETTSCVIMIKTVIVANRELVSWKVDLRVIYIQDDQPKYPGVKHRIT